MLKISERGLQMPASPIRKLVGYAQEAELRGIKVYYLNIGQPDIKTPHYAIERIRNFNFDLIPYGHSAGIESYRKKLAHYYQNMSLNVDFNDILITNGGSEAIIFSFLACFNPGDEIIIPEPFYANYLAFAIHAGIKIVPITSYINDNYKLPSIEDFEKKITSRTKGIFICNPNNPTGYLYSQEELIKIKDIIKKYNLFLLSDEVYNEFVFDNEKHCSVLEFNDVKDNVIVMDSVSKRFSCCGIRVGALISRNKDVINTILKLCQARLCAPMLGQMVAEAALDDSDEYMQDVKNEYLKRRDFLINALNKIKGVRAPLPKGAFYSMIELPVDNSEDFCRWLLTDFSYNGQTVMLAPSTGFYITPNIGLNQARVAFVLNVEDMKQAVICIEKGLEEFIKINNK